jgi:hypothetical protein
VSLKEKALEGREKTIMDKKKLYDIEIKYLDEKKNRMDPTQPDKLRRQKKSGDEKKILENEFLKDPNWSYQKKVDLAIALGFTFAQVSKWNWDMRKKEGIEISRKKKK